MTSIENSLESILNNLAKYFQYTNYTIKTICKNNIEITGFVSDKSLNEEGIIDFKFNDEVVGQLRFTFINDNIMYSEHIVYDSNLINEIFEIIQYKKYTRIDYEL